MGLDHMVSHLQKNLFPHLDVEEVVLVKVFVVEDILPYAADTQFHGEDMAGVVDRVQAVALEYPILGRDMHLLLEEFVLHGFDNPEMYYSGFGKRTLLDFAT